MNVPFNKVVLDDRSLWQLISRADQEEKIANHIFLVLSARTKNRESEFIKELKILKERASMFDCEKPDKPGVDNDPNLGGITTKKSYFSFHSRVCEFMTSTGSVSGDSEDLWSSTATLDPFHVNPKLERKQFQSFLHFILEDQNSFSKAFILTRNTSENLSKFHDTPYTQYLEEGSIDNNKPYYLGLENEIHYLNKISLMRSARDMSYSKTSSKLTEISPALNLLEFNPFYRTTDILFSKFLSRVGSILYYRHNKRLILPSDGKSTRRSNQNSPTTSLYPTFNTGNVEGPSSTTSTTTTTVSSFPLEIDVTDADFFLIDENRRDRYSGGLVVWDEEMHELLLNCKNIPEKEKIYLYGTMEMFLVVRLILALYLKMFAIYVSTNKVVEPPKTKNAETTYSILCPAHNLISDFVRNSLMKITNVLRLLSSGSVSIFTEKIPVQMAYVPGLNLENTNEYDFIKTLNRDSEKLKNPEFHNLINDIISYFATNSARDDSIITSYDSMLLDEYMALSKNNETKSQNLESADELIEKSSLFRIFNFLRNNPYSHLPTIQRLNQTEDVKMEFLELIIRNKYKQYYQIKDFQTCIKLYMNLTDFSCILQYMLAHSSIFVANVPKIRGAVDYRTSSSVDKNGAMLVIPQNNIFSFFTAVSPSSSSSSSSSSRQEIRPLFFVLLKKYLLPPPAKPYLIHWCSNTLFDTTEAILKVSSSMQFDLKLKTKRDRVKTWFHRLLNYHLLDLTAKTLPLLRPPLLNPEEKFGSMSRLEMVYKLKLPDYLINREGDMIDGFRVRFSAIRLDVLYGLLPKPSFIKIKSDENRDSIVHFVSYSLNQETGLIEKFTTTKKFNSEDKINLKVGRESETVDDSYLSESFEPVFNTTYEDANNLHSKELFSFKLDTPYLRRLKLLIDSYLFQGLSEGTSPPQSYNLSSSNFAYLDESVNGFGDLSESDLDKILSKYKTLNIKSSSFLSIANQMNRLQKMYVIFFEWLPTKSNKNKSFGSFEATKELNNLTTKENLRAFVMSSKAEFYAHVSSLLQDNGINKFSLFDSDSDTAHISDKILYRHLGRTTDGHIFYYDDDNNNKNNEGRGAVNHETGTGKEFNTKITNSIITELKLSNVYHKTAYPKMDDAPMNIHQLLNVIFRKSDAYPSVSTKIDQNYMDLQLQTSIVENDNFGQLKNAYIDELKSNNFGEIYDSDIEAMASDIFTSKTGTAGTVLTKNHRVRVFPRSKGTHTTNALEKNMDDLANTYKNSFLISIKSEADLNFVSTMSTINKQNYETETPYQSILTNKLNPEFNEIWNTFCRNYYQKNTATNYPMSFLNFLSDKFINVKLNPLILASSYSEKWASTYDARYAASTSVNAILPSSQILFVRFMKEFKDDINKPSAPPTE